MGRAGIGADEDGKGLASDLGVAPFSPEQGQGVLPPAARMTRQGDQPSLREGTLPYLLLAKEIASPRKEGAFPCKEHAAYGQGHEEHGRDADESGQRRPPPTPAPPLLYPAHLPDAHRAALDPAAQILRQLSRARVPAVRRALLETPAADRV